MAANQVFTYEGIDRNGRKTKGEISGGNARLAKARLHRQGIRATRLGKKGREFSLPGLGAKATRRDVTLFTRQLATMIKAGIPLVQAFDIVAEGMDNPAMRDLIREIRDEVSAGNPLSHSMQARRKHFDALFCHLIAAGEQSGTLEGMLDRLATYMEKAATLRAKIKSAMTYPLAVIIIASIVSGILLIKVVPQFEAVFADFGAELPELTRMVVSMSGFMQEWWAFGLTTLLVLLLVCREAHRRYPVVYNAQQRLMLKLPILGDIINKSCIARFARTLATTFAAGVPLVDALDSTAGTVGNVVYLEAIHKIREDVATGMELNAAMKSAGIFPNMLVQMVATGEESGTLDGMLDKAASYYEEMVDTAVAGLTSLMEPLIVSFLSVIVGGLVIAMYLPIFNMGDAIGI